MSQGPSAFDVGAPPAPPAPPVPATFPAPVIPAAPVPAIPAAPVPAIPAPPVPAIPAPPVPAIPAPPVPAASSGTAGPSGGAASVAPSEPPIAPVPPEPEASTDRRRRPHAGARIETATAMMAGRTLAFMALHGSISTPRGRDLSRPGFSHERRRQPPPREARDRGCLKKQ